MKRNAPDRHAVRADTRGSGPSTGPPADNRTLRPRHTDLIVEDMVVHDDDDLAGAALALARAGWTVFPCESRDKRPHRGLAHGHLDATIDEDVINRWWRAW